MNPLKEVGIVYNIKVIVVKNSSPLATLTINL